MLGLSVGLGVVSAVSGYWLARALDASIAGAMATMAGVLFALAFAFAPERGLVAQARRRTRQRQEFARRMLLVHLLHHEHTPEADRECRVPHLQEHLRWTPAFAETAVRYAERTGTVRRSGERLSLTPAGRRTAQEAMVE